MTEPSRVRCVIDVPPGAAIEEFRQLLPATAHAVYVLVRQDGVALYIGQSRTPGQRLRRHFLKKPWWAEVSRIELHLVGGELEARQLERELTDLRRPLWSEVTDLELIRLGRLLASQPTT